MATLTQLTLDADGTIATSSLSDSDTDGAFFDDCNDAPDGVSSDYIEHDTGLTDGPYAAWFRLTNVNADFSSMDSLNIDVDVEVVGSVSNDLVDLTARIFAADNDIGTPLTAETATLGDQTDTSRVQRNVSFASLTGTKTQWDAAYIRFTFTYDRVAGSDSWNLRFYGCDIDGTYTVAASDPIPDRFVNVTKQAGNRAAFY